MKVAKPIMSTPTKLSDNSECLEFNKTIVLNKDEHGLLNMLVDAQIKGYQRTQSFVGGVPELETAITALCSIKEKLNAPTPNPN